MNCIDGNNVTIKNLIAMVILFILDSVTQMYQRRQVRRFTCTDQAMECL